MPKFVFDDVPLFRGLIADLFPGLDLPRVAYPQLKGAIEAELEKVDMRHDDDPTFQLQVDKSIQLYEIMLTRHTTMIVGPTGGGKTVCLQTLQKASLPAFDMVVKTSTINPKAQSVNELYGVMDEQTRDWTDGIFSKLFRGNNENLPPGKENEVRWIIFDGDVDAVWVENMNSVGLAGERYVARVDSAAAVGPEPPTKRRRYLCAGHGRQPAPHAAQWRAHPPPEPL